MDGDVLIAGIIKNVINLNYFAYNYSDINSILHLSSLASTIQLAIHICSTIKSKFILWLVRHQEGRRKKE